MPAADLTQLFAFESALESATKSVLHAAGLHDTYLSQSDASLPDSYIEILFTPGDATNQAVRVVADQPILDYDFYDGQLAIRIVTLRPAEQPVLLPGVASLHEAWAAGVRVALREAANPYTTANLPWHSVKTIRPLAAERGLDTASWLIDYTRLTFLVQFGIRSQAWPG